MMLVYNTIVPQP